jgi:hypothetical protein
MSNQFFTLKDVTAANALTLPGTVGLVDNIVNVAPELDRILGRPIPGVSYEATILTALGSNAGFRKVNSGVALSAPSLDMKRFNCFPFDCQFSVDQALLIKGATQGESPAEIFTTFATSGARQKALSLGRQFYEGSLNDPLGPPGLQDFLFTQRTQIDSRTGLKINQVVDAGGTAAGNCETVWFIKQGPQGVHWLFGGGTGIIMYPWLPQYVNSPDSTVASPRRQLAWNSNLFGWIGTSMAQYHAVGAIINVDAVSNGTTNGIPTYPNPLTDGLAAEMWGLWPITMKPDLCFASQRAIVTLQMSRSVTNFVNSSQRDWTGRAAPIADFPTHLPTCGGIPIIPTDSIVQGNQYILN